MGEPMPRREPIRLPCARCGFGTANLRCVCGWCLRGRIRPAIERADAARLNASTDAGRLARVTEHAARIERELLAQCDLESPCVPKIIAETPSNRGRRPSANMLERRRRIEAGEMLVLS